MSNRGSPCRRYCYPYLQHDGTLGHGDHSTHTSRTAKSACTPAASFYSYRCAFWRQPKSSMTFIRILNIRHLLGFVIGREYPPTLIYDVAYGTLRLIRRSLSYPLNQGADLNLTVGCPKPEASVFYTKACTMLGPLISDPLVCASS